MMTLKTWPAVTMWTEPVEGGRPVVSTSSAATRWHISPSDTELLLPSSLPLSSQYPYSPVQHSLGMGL